MSSANSNNNGKAVVKEQVSSPTAMEVVPQTTFQPPPVTQQENNYAHHHQTPLMNSSVTDDKSKVVHEAGSSSLAPPSSVPEPPATTLVWKPVLGFRELMQHCVAALEAGNLVEVNADLRAMSFLALASPSGNPAQRVAFAFAEALARRALQATLPGLSWALGLHLQQQPAAAAAYTDAARRCFDSQCPFLRVAASAANQAIVAAAAAAAAGKKQVHVVDLGGASPDQWLGLLRLFAARPGGVQQLRLSVVSEQEGFLSRAAGVLTQEAVSLRVPFVFNPVRSHIDRFSPADIAALGARRRSEAAEALVITSTLQLHRLLADEVTVELPGGPPRQVITRADALLRVLRDLSPELVVLTEQEAEHNGAGLWDRAGSAFGYYAALFGDLEVATAGGESPADRAAVERVLLREEIADIVAREGSARRERHEGVRSWARRMGAAGFEPAPVVMSYDAPDAGLQAQQLAADGTLRYWVRKEDAFIVVYSRTTPIFSVTAWRPAKKSGK